MTQATGRVADVRASLTSLKASVAELPVDAAAGQNQLKDVLNIAFAMIEARIALAEHRPSDEIQLLGERDRCFMWLERAYITRDRFNAQALAAGSLKKRCAERWTAVPGRMLVTIADLYQHRFRPGSTKKLDAHRHAETRGRGWRGKTAGD